MGRLFSDHWSRMSIDEHTKPRINASILSNYIGKNVSLLGIAKNVDTSGSFFTLTTCDKKDVKVMLQEPLTNLVTGLTEIYGMVKSHNSVICDEYVVIPEETAATFNMSLYLKAIEYTQRCSNLYIQGGNIED